jgi:hypothetical protein
LACHEDYVKNYGQPELQFYGNFTMTLSHLFRLRDALDRMEVDLGLASLNDLDRRVIETLAFQAEEETGPLTIKYVLESPLLERYSRASVYRSLKVLETNNFISVFQDETDARRSFVRLTHPTN